MSYKKTDFVLGAQHVLAMFGATVLVPYLTGLDPALAILCAGVGTLLFHACTKGVVPVFLGSSFAFIGAISLTYQKYTAIALEKAGLAADLISQAKASAFAHVDPAIVSPEVLLQAKLSGIAAVKSGVIAAGLVYVMMAGVIKCFGVQKVRSFFPPIVTGPIIMVIGLRLSPVALGMSGYNVAEGSFDTLSVSIAGFVILCMVVFSVFAKGYFKLVPILASVLLGYLLCLILMKSPIAGADSLIDFAKISTPHWFGLSAEALADLKTMPSWNWGGITAIAPIALVVFIEHIGDITTNGAVVGKDFFKNPGINRTMLGDGLATVFAGFCGGPANTTYSENTGVLAVTKVYDPKILRIAAVYAIIISFVGPFGGAIRSIPVPVMGGISVILFGMIASVGVRTMVEAKLDFSHSRNLLIASLILVCGIAIQDVHITSVVTVSGLAIAALIGVVLHKILPQDI
jgi:uracil permease